VVHDAVETVLSGRRRLPSALAAALLCSAALAAGCGSSSPGSSSENVELALHSTQDVGESVRSDTCAQWQTGNAAQRHGTIIRMRKFAGGQVGSSSGMQNGPVLTDERAEKIFNSFCSRPYARAFNLYKLYTRAAGFIGN
jgi:hypothetical protein